MVEDYQENYITGWIKLYRSFINWEWFQVPNMITVFVYCLLKANHKNKRWQGIEIKKGTFITSYEKMSNDINISVQSVRTCLKRLEKSGEINRQSNKRHTVVTICNYNTYQNFDEESNTLPNRQLTNNQQTTNKQLTTTNNDKNDNNVKNILVRREEFKNSLHPFLEKYGKDMLNDFYLYWTEKKPKGRKMRFELEKTFDINLRLQRWFKNEKRFNEKKVTSKKTELLIDILKERHGINN